MDAVPAGYEWDPIKARANLAKHGVAFVEAARVFDDPDHQASPEAFRIEDEDQFLIIGTAAGRVLVVIYSYRGDRIRVISARPATKRERYRHEKRR